MKRTPPEAAPIRQNPNRQSSLPLDIRSFEGSLDHSGVWH